MPDSTQNDPRGMARSFNEGEAVWRRDQKKRLLFLLRHSRESLTAEELERAAWNEAEAEVRPTRCIGSDVP
jgi:hypothetical protein